MILRLVQYKKAAAMTVKRFSPLIGAAAVALLLVGCASRGDGFRTADVDYDGYYDNYYGPISDGYWGSNGMFYYQAGEGHAYHRDGAHHVRRDAATGFQTIHGHHNDNPHVSDRSPRLTPSGRPATNPLQPDSPRR